MDLERLVDDLAGDLGAEHLEDRILDGELLDLLHRLLRVVLARAVELFEPLVHVTRHAVAGGFERVEVDEHLPELCLDRAEVGDRLAERDAFLGVHRGDLCRALCRAERADAELEAPDVEDVKRDLVPLADLAEHVLFGDLDLFEVEQPGRGALEPHLLLFGACGDALAIGLDEDGAELVAIDLTEHREQVREPRVGDPHLLAIDDVVLAILA